MPHGDATPLQTARLSADRGMLAELREVLRAAGFDGEGVRAALGAGSDLLSRSVDIPLHERRLEGREPLGTLIRLLVLATPVSCEAAARAFAPLDLASVETAGIVSSSG